MGDEIDHARGGWYVLSYIYLFFACLLALRLLVCISTFLSFFFGLYVLVTKLHEDCYKSMHSCVRNVSYRDSEWRNVVLLA